jgi:hypothetical protein
LFEEARRIWTIAPTEDVAVFGGRAAEQIGRLPDFLPQLEDAERHFPYSEAVRTLLFVALAVRAERALADTRTLADAERDLEQMLRLQPDNCGPYYGLAKAAARKGALSEATRHMARGHAVDRAGTCARMVAADPILSGLLR